jgi:hypothetical protein
MRVGIIVDGDAESMALRPLVGRISIQGVVVIPPVYSDLQPKTSARQIARAAQETVGILSARGADRVVVLIDKEDLQSCPGGRADLIRSAFAALGMDFVSVVVKCRQFENWLLTDPEAFKRNPKRFRLTKEIRTIGRPDRADSVDDPVAAIDRACKDGRPYHKRHDAILLTANQRVTEVAAHSRSFRRFLRLLGHTSYLSQSRVAAS